MIPVPIQIQETEVIQMIDLETLHIIEIEFLSTIRIETFQMIEIINIVIDHANLLTTDRTIKDQNITNIKIDHAKIHKTEIQDITTDEQTTLNHHIGKIHVIKIPKKIKKVVHLNIKCKSTKQKQLKEVNQTLLVLIKKKPLNCN